MEFLFQNFWIALLAVTVLNAFWMRKRSEVYAQQHPSLIPGYKKLFKYFLIFGSIPWLIMGTGNLTGLTSLTHEYLNPASGNPIVLLFHLLIVSYWILGGLWIFFNNGAAFIERHPGFFNKKLPFNTSAVNQRVIKGTWIVMVVGGILGEIMMWWPKNKSTTIHAMNGEFQLVYDFGECYPHLTSLIPLAISVLGLGIAWFHKKYIDPANKSKAPTRQKGIVLGMIIGSISGILFVFLTFTSLSEYFTTRAIYVDQKYLTIEGTVSNYHPMPSSGHDTERFDVDSVHFKYSDFGLSNYGYNNAASHGGAIRDSLYVRIGYFAKGSTNVILRLEVRN